MENRYFTVSSKGDAKLPVVRTGSREIIIFMSNSKKEQIIILIINENLRSVEQ